MQVQEDRTWPVALSHEPAFEAGSLGELAAAALGASRSVPYDALELARSWSTSLPLPGRGATLRLWEALATVGAIDLSVARALEPHLDAVAILAEAGHPAPTGTWGVFAAEGPGARLQASHRPDADTGADQWLLDGTKPWCSLAEHLTHALVTAWVDDHRRGLFAVELDHPGVHPATGSWHARGLSAIPSGPVDFTGVPAVSVGEPGWYLERSGFAWGGIGVAAIWYGGAVAVARRVLRGTRERRPDQLALVHLGDIDRALFAARSVLAEAATRIDAGRADGDAGALLALRVRNVVADTVERVLTVADHALGPAPLALEAEHAQRVADLRLYVRQHHAERDSAALGSELVAKSSDPGPPW